MTDQHHNIENEFMVDTGIQFSAKSKKMEEKIKQINNLYSKRNEIQEKQATEIKNAKSKCERECKEINSRYGSELEENQDQITKLEKTLDELREDAKKDELERKISEEIKKNNLAEDIKKLKTFCTDYTKSQAEYRRIKKGIRDIYKNILKIGSNYSFEDFLIEFSTEDIKNIRKLIKRKNKISNLS